MASLISKLPSVSPSFLLASRYSAAAGRVLSLPRASPLLRLRPLLSIADSCCLNYGISRSAAALRCFSTRPTTSSLNDPSPNWSNRPPKETILLDGCDFEHWLVVMEPPEANATRDDIIDNYIKTLAQVVGSEDDARMKIYSVSTKHYFAFGALVSEELSYKIKTLPNVRWVLPDSYLDVKNKDYGGEPFIDGKAVPYDPKYHEEWVRNNARANERSRRNDRPRNYDRSRNFERRRENMQNRDAPMQPMSGGNGPNPMPPRDMPPPMSGGSAPNAMPPRDMPPRDFNAMPPRDVPPRDFNAMPPRDMPPRDFNAMPPRDMPPRDFNAMPPRDMPPAPNRDFNHAPNTQSSYAPNRDGGPGYQGGGQGYQQGGNPGGMQGRPGYQGSGPGYQGGPGGGSGYQGGPGGGSGYQGGAPGYQTGGGGYQGGGPGYQGGGPGYQGGGPGYQSSGGGYQGGNPDYQGGGPSYQGRDVPGRD